MIKAPTRESALFLDALGDPADAPDLAHLSDPALRVLATAAALFHAQGAAATSVRDITSACGISPGALYNHFASKDDLLFALVRHGHERIERRIDRALDESGAGAAARTSAFVHAYVLGHLLQPELAQVVRREYLHLSPVRREQVVHRRRALRDQLRQLLHDGAVDGDFDLIDGPDGALRDAVMVLDLCSRVSEWYRPARGEPRDRRDAPEQLADRYVTAALRLVGVRGAPPRTRPNAS